MTSVMEMVQAVEREQRERERQLDERERKLAERFAALNNREEEIQRITAKAKRLDDLQSGIKLRERQLDERESSQSLVQARKLAAERKSQIEVLKDQLKISVAGATDVRRLKEALEVTAGLLLSEKRVLVAENLQLKDKIVQYAKQLGHG
jgi:hypothetical protein